MPTLPWWFEIVRIPPVRSLSGMLAIAGLLILGSGQSVAAQSQSGTLVVTVRREDSTRLRGAIVRADRIGATTDGAGTARLELPARLVTVSVSHPGYVPRVFEITILPALSQRFDLQLERETALTRRVYTGRTIDSTGSSARAVATLGADDLDLATQQHPTDLTRLFPLAWGLRAQQQASPLDGTRLRQGGLRGQYTGILVDGLPLLGVDPGAFGLLHLGPFEFAQAEFLPGAAGAIYGPVAAGGVVNLISRRPERDQARLGVNQSSEKGGDLMFWGARRQSGTLSGSLTANLHQQRLVDSDDDGWGEFPRAVSLSIRPRVFVERPNGDALTGTIGVFTEERAGGYISTNTAADLYREERQSRQADAAIGATKNLGAGTALRINLTTVFQGNTHKFGGLRERDRRVTVAADASIQKPLGSTLLVAGVSYWRYELHERDFPAFDYAGSAPGLFTELSAPLGTRTRAILAGRCDDHSLHGIQCVPRLDLRYRGPHGFGISAYGGLSYTSPTSIADEIETLGLHGTIPVGLKAERVGSAGLAIEKQGRRWDVRLSGGIDRVRLPLRPVAVLGDSTRLRLLNVAEPTRAATVAVSVGYQAGAIGIRTFYRYQKATEGVPGGSGRRDTDLTPRHELGGQLNWRAPAGAGTEIQLEGIILGDQVLSDNPYRASAPGYPLASALVSQRSGRARIYLSAENLFDRKLRSFEPVVLTGVAAAGRRTTSPWVPLRGREISLGALVDW